MFNNPRIFVKKGLVVSFSGPAISNVNVLEGASDEASFMARIPELESSTGTVVVEMHGDDAPERRITTIKSASPHNV